MNEQKEKLLGHVQLPVDWIEVPRERITSIFEPEILQELIESIKERGILVPISVLYVNGHYYLIDGLHRLQAAKQLGIQKIPALVKEGDEYDLMIENLIANRMRGRSNPAEEAKLIRKMKDEWGWSYNQIAKKLGMSAYTVKQYYDISKLPDEVLSHVAYGRLSVGKAWLLLQLPDPRDQIRAAEDIVKYGYTESQVRELVKYYLEAYQEVGAPSPPAIIRPQKESQLFCEICNTPFKDTATYHWVCDDCWNLINQLIDAYAMLEAEKEQQEDDTKEESAEES